MPINRPTALSQLNRCGSLPFWSALTDEAVTDLVNVMVQYAENKEHAAAAITAYLESADVIPTRKTLTAVLMATRKTRMDASAPPPNGYCGQCENGWVRVRRWTQPPGYTEAIPYDFAGQCPCTGRWVEGAA